jgi:hypothetical protein
MQLEYPNQKVFKLSDALSRLDYISPEIQAAKQRVDKYILESKIKPNEIATPLSWNVTFFEISAYMILEELRKHTFGRWEGAVIKSVGEAKARLETDNYNIICLEAKNDLKQLYVSSVINDNYTKILKDNSSFFEEVYKDAEILENKRLILPSDLIKIKNYNEEIKNELRVHELKQDIYRQNLNQIIDEKKVTLSPEGAIKTNLYQFNFNKINNYMRNHPEIQKNVDLFAILRSENIYKKIKEKKSIEEQVSITIRRVVFEGPFLMLKNPSLDTFTSLFKDPNGKVKKAIFENTIKEAQFELEASVLDFTIRAKKQYYEVQSSYKDLEEARNDLNYHSRVFFEQQQLYRANLTSLVNLVDAKAALYKSELNYLNKLEKYNIEISNLQYYVGNYQEG